MSHYSSEILSHGSESNEKKNCPLFPISKLATSFCWSTLLLVIPVTYSAALSVGHACPEKGLDATSRGKTPKCRGLHISYMSKQSPKPEGSCSTRAVVCVWRGMQLAKGKCQLWHELAHLRGSLCVALRTLTTMELRYLLTWRCLRCRHLHTGVLEAKTPCLNSLPVRTECKLQANLKN